MVTKWEVLNMRSDFQYIPDWVFGGRMKDAFYNLGDQKIESSKFMPLEQLSEFMGRSSYSCLTASKEYDQIIETTRPQDIAKGNASDVETGSSYKNRTFIWNYGNRLEALKTQLDRGYNPEDIEEALNILNPKIEAKKDFYLKSQVKSLKASIRGKKQAQEYADKLADSDEFKRYIFSTDIGDIVDGIGVERVFPIHSPSLSKIEVVRHGKVRRAKLYYLRTAKGKKAKLKKKDFAAAIAPEEPVISETAEAPAENTPEN